MDKNSIELAQLDLNATYEALRPEYRRLDEALTAELAINKSHEQEQIDARNNAVLLQRFADLLPHANVKAGTGSRGSIEVSSPVEMRAIQSSVVWVRAWSGAVISFGYGVNTGFFPSSDYTVRPYWLLGQGYKSQTQKEFLLAPVVSDASYMSSNTSSPTQRFLEKTGDNLVVLTPSGHDQNRLSALSSNLFSLPLQESEHYPMQVDHKSPGAEIVSHYARVAPHKLRPTTGITDFELAKYDAFRHANRLAALFDKKDEFAALLGNYPETSPETSEIEK